MKKLSYQRDMQVQFNLNECLSIKIWKKLNSVVMII